MTTPPAPSTTSSTSPVPAADAPPLLVGSKIAAGYGGINQALAEGKGWTDEDVLAYAKTIGDNHPMFAETVEVGDENLPSKALALPSSFPVILSSLPSLPPSLPAPSFLFYLGNGPRHGRSNASHQIRWQELQAASNTGQE